MKNRKKIALAVSMSVGALLAVAATGLNKRAAARRTSDYDHWHRNVASYDENEVHYV